jgi:hypothetical protein
LRQVAATLPRLGIARQCLRACGKDRALIPPDRLAILLSPRHFRASTSAADEAKTTIKKRDPSSSTRHNRGETHETS